MRIAAYLMVSLMAVSQCSATFRRHKVTKNKGPFGGYLADFGTAAIDGILRYAPDFYDVVPKVAHKLLSGGKKHQHQHRYNNYYDEEYPVHNMNVKRPLMKRLNNFLTRPQYLPVPVYPTSGLGHAAPISPVHHAGIGYGAFGHGAHAGFSSYPFSIPHGSFDELPVHGVFQDPIDYSSKFNFNDFDTNHFDGFYDHDHFDYLRR